MLSLRGRSMRRREFIIGASSLVAFWPLAVRAQQASKLPTIGYLGPNVEPVDRPRIAAFAQRLGELVGLRAAA